MFFFVCLLSNASSSEHHWLVRDRFMILIYVFVQSWKNVQKGRMGYFLHHKSFVLYEFMFLTTVIASLTFSTYLN